MSHKVIFMADKKMFFLCRALVLTLSTKKEHNRLNKAYPELVLDELYQILEFPIV